MGKSEITVIAAALFSFAFSYEFGYVYMNNYTINIFFLIAGIFGIIAFAFGLSGGIFSLKRRRLVFSVFGMSLLIASGIMMAIPVWVYGLPIATLLLLSVIFVAISKDEFT